MFSNIVDNQAGVRNEDQAEFPDIGFMIPSGFNNKQPVWPYTPWEVFNDFQQTTETCVG
jgi:hypothetical protein